MKIKKMCVMGVTALALLLVACGVNHNTLTDEPNAQVTDAKNTDAPKSDASVTTTNTPEPEDTAAVTEIPNQEVNADLQAFLDSYESFIDEYCEFMKKYMNADSLSMLGMIADYTDYATRLVDMENKANALDSSTMTTEDYLYYSEVMLRCSQKIMQAVSE